MSTRLVVRRDALLVAPSLRRGAGRLVVIVGSVWFLPGAGVPGSAARVPPVTVEVQTEALGLSAEEVEQLITVPLEAGPARRRGVARPDPLAVGARAVVDRPVLRAGHRPLPRPPGGAGAHLTQAPACPTSRKPPPMLQPLSSTSRVMMISLSSEDAQPMHLGVLARWTIRPRLMGVPGVANVSIWGQRERQLQVQVDPAAAARAGRLARQVISTTGNALWVSPLTLPRGVDAGHRRVHRHGQPAPRRSSTSSPISTPADLAQVPIDESPTTASPAHASATSRRWSRTTSRSSATRSSTDGDGPVPARHREVPGSQHRSR